jgi:hypothetical protein
MMTVYRVVRDIGKKGHKLVSFPSSWDVETPDSDHPSILVELRGSHYWGVSLDTQGDFAMSLAVDPRFRRTFLNRTVIRHSVEQRTRWRRQERKLPADVFLEVEEGV